MTFYQAAIDNFPEDQATIDADFALSLFETEGADYYHQWLIKERSSVIHNTFDDDQALKPYQTPSLSAASLHD